MLSEFFTWKRRRRSGDDSVARRCAAASLDALLAVSAVLILLQPAMLWYGIQQDSCALLFKLFITCACVWLRPSLHSGRNNDSTSAASPLPRRGDRMSGNSMPRPAALATIVLLLLSVCIAPAQAQLSAYLVPVGADDGGVVSIPAILGAIWTVVSAIWNILSALWSAFVWGLAVSKYLACWCTALLIAAYVVLQLLEFYNLAVSTSIFRVIDNFFLRSLDCTPIQPEYGPFRKENFRDGKDPTPQPTSFFDIRKRNLGSSSYMSRVVDHGDVVYPHPVKV